MKVRLTIFLLHLVCVLTSLGVHAQSSHTISGYVVEVNIFTINK